MTDTIQIPDALLSGTLVNSTRVQVRALSFVPIATRAHFEPVTTEDWELLQVHAELLEQGGLLEQLSLVYLDQPLALIPRASKHGINRIHVVVREISTLFRESLSLWPDLIDDDSYESTVMKKPGVAMLANNTEIIITPKPRTKACDAVSWSNPLQVVPGALDIRLESWASLQEKLPGIQRLPLMAPGCILIHPDSISLNPSWVEMEWMRMRVANIESKRGEVRSVRVILSSDTPKATAGMLHILGIFVPRKPCFHDENRNRIIK